MESVITFIKGDKVGADTDYRDYLPVNMSGILRPMFGAQGYMSMIPGLVKYGEGVDIDRGGIWNERHENHYRVSGGSLISVDSAGNSVVLGSISGLDTVSMPYSFNTQAVIADGRMWLYSPSGGFAEVTDPDLGDPLDGVWVDGYYFLTDGENVYHTDIADETAIDPLKFATSEFSPDPTYGVGKTDDNKAMAFNRYSIEYFENRANENFAFTRLTSRALSVGIVGTHCKAKMKGRWYIIGGGKDENITIYSVGIGSTNKIASREVDSILADYTDAQLSASFVETRIDKGYQFAIFHLPNKTLMYNVTLGDAVGPEYAWSLIKSDVAGTDEWRAKHGIFEPRRGQWVYGDKSTSNLGYIDYSSATHYNQVAEWELHTPFMFLDGKSIDELEIETIPGFTDTNDGTVFVSLTYNGITHGSEWTQAYGGPSDYGKRFEVRRLGYVSDWAGIKLRGASKSRMAFGAAKVRYG